MEFNIISAEEEKLKIELAEKTDPESKRILRFINMPDLSRTPGSPIYEIANRIVDLEFFKAFDVIQVPEIIDTNTFFEPFDFPKDHPVRSKSDSYFADDNHILRAHTTIMWYYYLNEPAIKQKIAEGKPVGSLCYGKVYRKDEIDRNHMNVFHQMDGWYLCRREEKIIGPEDLQKVLIEIAKAIFGQDIKYRFNEDIFPYTDPSLEMEINLGNPPSSRSGRDSGEAKWVEVLGCGVVKGKVLKNLGVDPEVYNGWAFGFGLERLAIISMELPDIRLLWSEDERVKRQLKLGNRFKEVSKFPPITRDVSFVVDKDFIPNNYFDLIRDIGGNLVEEVKLLDKYENPEKFGPDKISYTYRIIYRSNERTLESAEVDPLQEKIYDETKNQFGAELR